jgi:hypothetical protein
MSLYLSIICWVVLVAVVALSPKSVQVKLTGNYSYESIENPLARVAVATVGVLVISAVIALFGLLFTGFGKLVLWIGMFMLTPITSLF